MIQPLDLLAALLCGFVSLCAFTMHVVSSPRRKAWLTLPAYLRAGFLAVGVAFLWRSVNFISISPAPVWTAGHINVEGVMAFIALAYMAGAAVAHIWRHHLTDFAWDRLFWAEATIRDRPGLVAVVLEQREVTEVARAQGIIAAGPGEPPEALDQPARGEMH